MDGTQNLLTYLTISSVLVEFAFACVTHIVSLLALRLGVPCLSPTISWHMINSFAFGHKNVNCEIIRIQRLSSTLTVSISYSISHAFGKITMVRYDLSNHYFL